MGYGFKPKGAHVKKRPAVKQKRYYNVDREGVRL